MTRTAASLIGIVAVFALVLYLTYGGSGGGTDATPTPSAILAASPTRTPTPTAPPRVTPFRPLPPVLEGDEVEYVENRSLVNFPEDTALIMETGCWQCDGPSTGLRRMYRDPSGEVRVEQLLSIDQLGIVPASGFDPFFAGYAITRDASNIVTSVCLRGGCAFGTHFWSEDAHSTLFQSIDGGVTWRNLGDYDLGLTVEGDLGGGLTLISWRENPDGPPTYAKFPGFEIVIAPGDEYSPAFAVDGEVIWRRFTGSGLLVRGDGSTFVNFGEPVAVVQDLGMAAYSSPELVPVEWSFPHQQSSVPFPRYFISLMNAAGKIESSIEIHSTDTYLLSAFWYGEGTLIGTMANTPLIGAPDYYLGLLPAIVDLDTFYNNIEEPFFREGYDPQRDIIRAVRTGALARVTGVEGSCLNIRLRPGFDTEVLDCVAGGVLVEALVQTTPDLDGSDWVAVETPAGVVGWAAAEHLEY